MKHDKPTLEQAMTYAQMMENCASYIEVKNPTIKEPHAVYSLMAPIFQGRKQESFFTLLLDCKSRIIGAPLEITRGLVDSCPVHPREVFRLAITESASAVVIIHNHPTGDPTPSREDLESTRRLVEASRIIGIPIFDHVIIGTTTQEMTCPYISLREKNLVSFSSMTK